VQNSGVLISIDHFNAGFTCGDKATYVFCQQSPEPLPVGWSIAHECAVDTTGAGTAVLPNNVAVPLEQVGDGIAVSVSFCIDHCVALGHTFAAVENCECFILTHLTPSFLLHHTHGPRPPQLLLATALPAFPPLSWPPIHRSAKLDALRKTFTTATPAVACNVCKFTSLRRRRRRPLPPRPPSAPHHRSRQPRAQVVPALCALSI
jgi:hypothetical protein